MILFYKYANQLKELFEEHKIELNRVFIDYNSSENSPTLTFYIVGNISILELKKIKDAIIQLMSQQSSDIKSSSLESFDSNAIYVMPIKEERLKFKKCLNFVAFFNEMFVNDVLDYDMDTLQHLIKLGVTLNYQNSEDGETIFHKLNVGLGETLNLYMQNKNEDSNDLTLNKIDELNKKITSLSTRVNFTTCDKNKQTADDILKNELNEMSINVPETSHQLSGAEVEPFEQKSGASDLQHKILKLNTSSMNNITYESPPSKKGQNIRDKSKIKPNQMLYALQSSSANFLKSFSSKNGKEEVDDDLFEFSLSNAQINPERSVEENMLTTSSHFKKRKSEDIGKSEHTKCIKESKDDCDDVYQKNKM